MTEELQGLPLGVRLKRCLPEEQQGLTLGVQLREVSV